jgi:selenocysteine-specific elongation factor
MIVGTAGHIDHGKTSLVRRLTGVETDRLKEEKARGISIELGFAYWPRPSGEIIGFVDVPGHEALVHNMLAGATGIDFAMLVVAADDGVMPQTREHLAIMKLLGLERGIVALNKCDLVPPDRLREVSNEIANTLIGSGLETAGIVPVSAVTGEGIAELTVALDAALSNRVVKRSTDGRFRLAIDRCFTLSGLGTTVTGTVLSGKVAVDDRVMISPSGIEARVRSIRAHDRPADIGEAGQRCALVLAGPQVAKTTINRGDVVLDPVLHAPTQRFDALVHILADESKPIGQWFPVKVHHAAAEVPGRVVVLRDTALTGGESDFIQLVLDRPIAAAAGDRFVIRDTSSSRTIGGGTLIDLRALERRRRTPERRQMLDALSHSDPAEALSHALASSVGWIDLSAFMRDRCLNDEASGQLVSALNLTVLPLSSSIAAMSSIGWQKLADDVAETLTKFHSAEPDSPGIGMEHLRRRVAPHLPSPIFLAAIRRLIESNVVALDRTWVRRPDHRVTFTAVDEKNWSAIRPRLSAEPYRPPRVRDIAKALSMEEAAVRRLMRMAAKRGDVDEVAHDHYFLREIVQHMAEIAIDVAALAPGGKFTAADFRDRLDNGRKVAIQILEFFDRHGLTMRRQDLRRINPARIELFAPSRVQPEIGGVPLPVGRPDFKSGWGRQTVPGGFDSHPPPPSSREVQ